MKPVVIALVTLAAAPAFAHTGVHMHPHASDASWLAVLAAGLVIAGSLVALRARSK